MNKPLLLKLYRWITLVFALPLLAIILTGLILSFEPALQATGAGSTSLDPARVIILSPLTGLLMALGLTFQGGSAPASPGRPIPLSEAVGIVGKSRDLAQVTSIGIRGGRLMARIFDGGELRAYAVGADGIAVLPRNWPRLIHEGNWSTTVASALNVITSVVLLGLLSTGLLLWARRRFRRAPDRRKQRRGGEVSAGSVTS